jgi:hypothetical protein
MKTRVVNVNNVSVNNLTQYGRKRNDAIWNMLDRGYQVIREYRENWNSRIYIGYRNKYTDKAEYIIRVCRNGAVETKETRAMCSHFPGGVKSYCIEKTRENVDGSISFLRKLLKIKNGKTILKDELKIESKNQYRYEAVLRDSNLLN